MSARSTGIISIICCRCCAMSATRSRAGPHPCRDPEGQGLRAGGEVRRQISRRRQVQRHHRRAGRRQAERAELHQGLRQSLIQEARKDDEKIVAITAAMPAGTGLDLFAGVSGALLRCRHRRAARRDLRRRARRKATSRSPRSTPPSCSAPMTRWCMTWPCRSCRCASPSTARGSSAPTARPMRALSTSPISPACPASSSWPPRDEAELMHMVATAAAIDDRPCAFRYPRGEGTGGWAARSAGGRWRSARARAARGLGGGAAVVRRAACRMPEGGGAARRLRPVDDRRGCAFRQAAGRRI